MVKKGRINKKDVAGKEKGTCLYLSLRQQFVYPGRDGEIQGRSDYFNRQ